MSINRFKYNPHIHGLHASVKKPEKLKQELFRMYVFKYMNLAANRFLWKNLPKEIYQFAIEKFLLDSKVMFFQDEYTKLYAVLPAGGAGKMDIYGYSNTRYSVSSQYVEFRDKLNSVLLQDMIIDVPIMYYIYIYSDILSELKVTKLVNINAQKNPVIISGPSDMELTINNVINQIENNIPILKVKDNILGEKININTLSIKADYVADKIDQQMLREESELLTIMGIDSHVDSKNERLVSNEVLGNKGMIENFRTNGLNLRKNFADKVNEIFGLSIQVDFNTEIPLLLTRQNINLDSPDEGV